MANEYIDLAELKASRRVPASNVQDDLTLQARITRASRAIDTRCRGEGGHFYADSTATARTYKLRGRTVAGYDGVLLLVDDISSLTDLVIEYGNGSSWSAVTDYEAEPENALARGRAIEALRRAGWGSDRVRVTARWGWPVVPDNVREATWLLANRRYVRKDSPEGVANWSQEGAIRVSRFDPDIEDLLTPYIAEGFA